MSEKENKKNAKVLIRYAVIFVLVAVIIIIVAMMADNRESEMERQRIQTETVNSQIEGRIVSLTNENATLKQENESLTAENKKQEEELSFYHSLQDVWTAAESGNSAEVQEKLKASAESAQTEEQKKMVQTIGAVLSIAAKQ